MYVTGGEPFQLDVAPNGMLSYKYTYHIAGYFDEHSGLLQQIKET